MGEPIVVTWQYCAGDRDITTEFYAEDDADKVRAWDNDFCLIEVTHVNGRGWVPTGGDGDWTRLADDEFASPWDALAAYMDGQPYVIAD